jgi:hypothetical protein
VYPGMPRPRWWARRVTCQCAAWAPASNSTRRARPARSVGKGHPFRLTGVHPF